MGDTLGTFIGISQYSQDVPCAIAIDEYDASTVYIGIAEIGTATSLPKWQIKKISKSGTVTITTWADGNHVRDNVWNDRLTLTYI